jgi:hypothetical protein
MLRRNKMTQYVIQTRGQEPATSCGYSGLTGDGIENYC